jgi:hypothetical protein
MAAAAMLSVFAAVGRGQAAQPKPAAAPSEPPPAAQQTQSSQGPDGVWVEFYGVCRKNDLVI